MWFEIESKKDNVLVNLNKVNCIKVIGNDLYIDYTYKHNVVMFDTEEEAKKMYEVLKSKLLINTES